MKSQVCGVFGFLTIFALILCIQSLEIEEPTVKDLCNPLRYARFDKENKPDLLVVESLAIPGLRKFLYGLCRIGNVDKSQYKAELIARSSFPWNNRFEYDSHSNAVYDFTFKTIQKTLLNNGKIKDVYQLHNVSNAVWSFPAYTALDWVTKNLYFFQDGALRILNVKDNSKTPQNLITMSNEKTFVPIVKVFPNEGYLVVLTSHGTLTRFNQDGSNPHELYNNKNVNIGEVALDYYESKIYWIESDSESKETQIRYTNLNGDEAKTFQITREPWGNYNERYLQVDKKYVYYVKKGAFFGGAKFNHFLRAKKEDGSFDKDFDLVESHTSLLWDSKFENILVLSSNPQLIAKDHPCQHNNGGCKGFCTAIPNTTHKLTKRCIDTNISYLKKGLIKLKNLFNSEN